MCLAPSKMTPYQISSKLPEAYDIVGLFFGFFVVLIISVFCRRSRTQCCMTVCMMLQVVIDRFELAFPRAEVFLGMVSNVY